jgi:hypothetical protein
MIEFEGIIITAEEIMKSGKDPSYSIQALPSWGQAPDAYIGEVDVFHQIHCLNTLQKFTHYDYYFDGPIDAEKEWHRDHCLLTLLQNLMCRADVGFVSVNWKYDKERERFMPHEDFNTFKKCVNFDAVHQSAKENAIPDFHQKWKALRIPPGAKTVASEAY